MTTGQVKPWHVMAAVAVAVICLTVLGISIIDMVWRRPPTDSVTLNSAPQLDPADHNTAAPRPFPKVPATFDDGSPRQTPEFEAIAKRLYAQGNPRFFSRGMIGLLRQALADPNLPAANRLELTGRLAQVLLNDGQVDLAAEQVESLGRQAEAAGVPPTIEFHRLRALVYLRKAEVQNCIIRHNAECCVFPLQGGGVHTQRDPAEQAKASYLAFLRMMPESLYGRWMINIIAMALGEHPEGLPAELVIPPSAFDSDYEIGRFTDIAGKAGVDTLNCAGGAIAQDFDSDGLIDLVTSSISPEQSMTFSRNNGDGTFTNMSAQSRLDDQFGGLNCNSADYDNDGDIDILVLRGGWYEDDGQIRKSLLQNDGRGVFTDVTRQAGLEKADRPCQVGVWADFDNDGDLDLFIGNESRIEGEPNGDYPCQLFRNNGPDAAGAWTFTDVARQSGVANDRYTKGAAAGDYDNDGDMDLYASNIGKNRLYRNDGNLQFTDVANQAGVTEPEGYSFATWFFDYDNDGWLDIWVGAYDATVADVAADYLGLSHHASLPRLYRNNRNGTFISMTKELGLDHAWLPMGASFGDLDNDGWLDVYLATGGPEYDTLVPNVMLRNDQARKFQDVTKSGGFGHLQKGHGVCFADLDNDGDQDVFNQLGGFYPGDAFRNTLYLNPGTAPGMESSHFIAITLQGVTSNRTGVGARIKLVVQTPSGAREIHRAAGSISSFGGSLHRQEIGLGDASAIERIEITWPASGKTQTIDGVPLDSFIRIVEGQGGFERLAPKSFDF